MDIENLDLTDVLHATPNRPKTTTGALVFDIETIPDFDRETLFDDADLLPKIPDAIPVVQLSDMVTPGEFVSQSLEECKTMLAARNPPPEWIESAIIAEKQQKKPRKGLFDLLQAVQEREHAAEHAVAERHKIMATTPEMCRIAAIGFQNGVWTESLEGFRKAEDEGHVVDDETETALLDGFWRRIANHRGPLVGFNVLDFDLPVIFVRSAMLDVQPARSIDLKPWGKDVIDLMYARYPKSKATGLKTLAKLYGIDVPAGDCDGSQVLELLRTDPDRLLKYVQSDVEITAQLYRKWRGMFCA